MRLFKKRGTTEDYLRHAMERKKKALAEYEMRQAEWIHKQSQILHESTADKQSTPYGEGFTLEDMEKSFGISSWVYKAIMVIAWNIAPVEKVIKNDANEEIDDHFLLPLLNQQPNPFESDFDMREKSYAYLDLMGNSFIEIVSEGNQIIGFTSLNPNQVEILADKEKYVTGYRYTVEGKKTNLAPEDVIRTGYFNPFDNYWGLSPLSAARLAVETDIRAAVWNRDFFSKGATPVAFIETEGKLDAVERNRIVAQWEKWYKGKQRTIGVIDGGGKINKVGSTQSDMEFLEQRRFSREEILAIYGVPPVLAGIFQFSTTTSRSAGAEQQQRMFWEECLIPRLTKMDKAFTRALRNRGLQITIESNLKPVKALQRDWKERAEIAEIALKSGLTLNEVRTQIWEVEPVEEEAGNIVFLPASIVPGVQNIEEEIENYVSDMANEKAQRKPQLRPYPKDIQDHLDRYQKLVA